MSAMTMAINAFRNKRYGPGGGTRHLHHFKGSLLRFMGMK